jgi:hypothetical protein
MLTLGWYEGDVREGMWYADDALPEVLPKDVFAAWLVDGEASHLRPFAKAGKTPMVFKFRALSLTEKAYVDGLGETAGYASACTAAFRIGIELPISAEPDRMESGAMRERYVRVAGIRMLAEDFVHGIDRNYPGFVRFFGRLIYNGSFLSEAEKKALLPSSTAKPSSAEVSTVPATEAAPKPAEVEAAAPAAT